MKTDIIELRQRFRDAWHSEEPVFYDNQPAVELPADKSAVFFAVHPNGSRHYMGSSEENGTMKSTGLVWLRVSVPAGMGNGKALDLTDQFAAIFRNWCSDDYAIQCETEQYREPAQDPDTKRMMYDVRVPYTSLRSY